MKSKIINLISWVFSDKGFGLMWYGFGIYSEIHKDAIGSITCFMIGFFIWGRSWIERLEKRIDNLEIENQNLKRRFNIIWEDYMCKK